MHIPYLLRDLTDIFTDIAAPAMPQYHTLPASINMDFNAEEDAEILEQTKEHCYWWKTVPGQRLTRKIIDDHFYEYYHVVSKSLSCC